MDFDLSTMRGKLITAVIAFMAVGLIYFIWTKSASPEPTLLPGQSISHPVGLKDNGPSRNNGYR